MCLFHISHEILDCIKSAGLNDVQLCNEVLIKNTLYPRGCVLPMQLGLGNRVMVFGQIELIAVSSSVNSIVDSHFNATATAVLPPGPAHSSPQPDPSHQTRKRQSPNYHALE